MSDGVETNGVEINGRTDGQECFLGVERSLRGKRWLNTACDERAALALAQRLGVPEIVGRVLSLRGVGLDDAEDFLDPTLKRLLPDPSSLKDMDVACERLVRAVMGGERIAIFGDYDVDGATSSALLTRFLTALGSPPLTYIPDRLREGYGPNEAALLGFKKDGVSVVVVVDCGTSAFAPLKAAAGVGLDVIVVDHHKAEPQLPEAVAIVNPNRLDEDGSLGQLAAVGLTFLLVVGLNRALGVAGYFENRARPNPLDWLDLVALGTICDVVPLKGVNRALVAQGLKVMGRRANPGLRALADVSGLTEPPATYHAGFILGPRINAAGRIGDSSLGARLLYGDDQGEAEDIARRLDELNRQRREIEAVVQDQAFAQAEEQDKEGAPLILAAGQGWHPGVIGIIAGRLVERFNRPACVVSLDGAGGSGSGRSVAGIDLGAAVIAASQSGLLVRGGGHAMAAGFTVDADRLEEFRAFLSGRVAEGVAAAGLVPSLRLDGALSVSAATVDVASALERVGPFGSGNREPRFVIPRAKLSRADAVGDNHLRCILSGEQGGRLEAIAFRCLDTDLGAALRNHHGAPFHIAGRLQINTWQGRSRAQLLIDDAAAVW